MSKTRFYALFRKYSAVLYFDNCKIRILLVQTDKIFPSNFVKYPLFVIKEACKYLTSQNEQKYICLKS